MLGGRGREGKGGRTLVVVVPWALEVDFCAEAAAHCAQAAAPCHGVCDGVVFVQVVLGEPGLDAFVRVRWVLEPGQPAGGAYPRRDALVNCLAFALDAQDLWAAHDADCLLGPWGALGEVDEDAERGREALVQVWYRGWVVCDERAQLGCGGLGLGEEV
jgi:hypothetical protein